MLVFTIFMVCNHFGDSVISTYSLYMELIVIIMFSDNNSCSIMYIS